MTLVGSRSAPLPGQLAARSQATGPPKKGGVSPVAVGAAAVTLTLGGTLAYAWLDPTFRDTLEASVPYADVPLGLVLGERMPQPPPPPMPEVPSKIRPKKPAPVSESKKQKAEDNASKSDAKVDEASRAAERARSVETDHAVENLALEQLLKELSQQAQMALDVAVDAQQRHVERVFRSLDDATEADWTEVKSSADIKTQMCEKAEELARNASGVSPSWLTFYDREYLDKLSTVIEDSRQNKVTATNEKLTPIQEALANAYYRLETAKNKVAAALSEARVMDEFRQLVDESRTKFQQEMSSIVPGVVLGEKNSKLSEEELNVLLVHAYRKVLYLQKELARMLLHRAS
ncbi:MICOS complex subunit Mic60-like [Pollicipes pollicipes]|uniref:MICOS complex subunit Mic60-like n=1 Tax=Pollicipes pollicipes TaxID=41117 RepID=UPI001884C667|nr:MICOS complex subunit Mic60-like [Pollicipes pollicipes]